MEENRQQQKEIFREDILPIQDLVEKSKSVLLAGRKLHLSICGGSPNLRPHKSMITANIDALKHAIADLEMQLERESLNEEEQNELTFF